MALLKYTFLRLALLAVTAGVLFATGTYLVMQRLLTRIVIGLGLTTSIVAQNDPAWPQWRGPLGTGVAPGGDPPTTWSESDNVRFKVDLPGLGHSTPVIHGDRIVAFTGQGRLVCLAAAVLSRSRVSSSASATCSGSAQRSVRRLAVSV